MFDLNKSRIESNLTNLYDFFKRSSKCKTHSSDAIFYCTEEKCNEKYICSFCILNDLEHTNNHKDKFLPLNDKISFFKKLEVNYNDFLIKLSERDEGHHHMSIDEFYSNLKDKINFIIDKHKETFKGKIQEEILLNLKNINKRKKDSLNQIEDKIKKFILDSNNKSDIFNFMKYIKGEMNYLINEEDNHKLNEEDIIKSISTLILLALQCQFGKFILSSSVDSDLLLYYDNKDSLKNNSNLKLDVINEDTNESFSSLNNNGGLENTLKSNIENKNEENIYNKITNETSTSNSNTINFPLHSNDSNNKLSNNSSLKKNIETDIKDKSYINNPTLFDTHLENGDNESKLPSNKSAIFTNEEKLQKLDALMTKIISIKNNNSKLQEFHDNNSKTEVSIDIPLEEIQSKNLFMQLSYKEELDKNSEAKLTDKNIQQNKNQSSSIKDMCINLAEDDDSNGHILNDSNSSTNIKNRLESLKLKLSNLKKEVK